MPTQFGDFTLDAATRQLLRDSAPVRISPKAFELLKLLLDERPRAMAKADLSRKLWPDTFVVEANLANLVAELRAALGDDAKSPRFIRTVYGFGYAFCGETVETRQPDSATPTPPPVVKRTPSFAFSVVILAFLSLFMQGAYVRPSTNVDSIAVLMFRVEPSTATAAAPQSNAYLSEGLAGSLIADLSTLDGVRVISENSIAALGGGNLDARDVARRVGVRAVMTGRIELSPSRVVVNAELVDGADGSVLLARRYSAPMEDLSLLEGSLAQDVVAKLKSQTSPERRQMLIRETADGEAYKLRLEGTFYARRLDPESQRKAIALFEQALRHDPMYARAYAQMARAYLMLGIFFDAPRNTMPRAKELANKALSLDDTLSDAHVNLGVVSLLYDWDRREAARQLVIASGLRPETIETFACSSHLLENAGRVVDAESEIRQALKADPLSSPLAAELGCNSYYQRRYDQSIDEYERALELDGRNVLAYFGLARAYAQSNRYADALAALKKVEAVNGFAPAVIVAEEGYVYARLGRRGLAEETLRELDRRSRSSFVDPFLRAIVYTGLQQNAEAIAFLEKAYGIRSGFMPSLRGDPKFDGLRGDPRFAELEKRVGI